MKLNLLKANRTFLVVSKVNCHFLLSGFRAPFKAVWVCLKLWYVPLNLMYIYVYIYMCNTKFIFSMKRTFFWGGILHFRHSNLIKHVGFLASKSVRRMSLPR